MSEPHFTMSCFDSFVYHCKRVKDCNLEYPIILDDFGQICDGWHRIAKAVLEGNIHKDKIAHYIEEKYQLCG